MPVQLENTTLSLSEISRLREIVLQTSIILNTEIDPFTIENLNKSGWWQYENARQVLSQALVAEGYAALPAFSISDINNNTLATVLVQAINDSLISGGSTTLLLVPNGATESVDGEFQRFVPNATDPLGHPAYYAELDAADWQESPISVQFKWPALTVVNDVLQIFFSSGNYDSIENPVGDETDSIFALLQLARTEGDGQGEPYNTANFAVYKFGAEPPTSEPVTLTPTAGDIATLTFTRTQMTLAVGGETQAYAIPAGIFTGVPLLNVVAKVESAALPLSIKVSVTS